jgi:hypothetical protein
MKLKIDTMKKLLISRVPNLKRKKTQNIIEKKRPVGLSKVINEVRKSNPTKFFSRASWSNAIEKANKTIKERSKSGTTVEYTKPKR